MKYALKERENSELTKWVKIQAKDRPGRRQMVHAPGEGRRMDGTIRYRITPQK